MQSSDSEGESGSEKEDIASGKEESGSEKEDNASSPDEVHMCMHVQGCY